MGKEREEGRSGILTECHCFSKHPNIECLMTDVALIIAHNAAFDRGFVESRFSFFQEKAWACSLAQIPWKNEGFSNSSLEFLAYSAYSNQFDHQFQFYSGTDSNNIRALIPILFGHKSKRINVALNKFDSTSSFLFFSS
jgi:hypothetical protein